MSIPSYAILEKEYQLLKSTLSKVNSPVVFAHNDLLLGNILYNQKQENIVFIDYEYTAFNYQAFDIVNHFTEYAGNYAYFNLFTNVLENITLYIKCITEQQSIS